jgi:hypothetical protein
MSDSEMPAAARHAYLLAEACADAQAESDAWVDVMETVCVSVSGQRITTSRRVILEQQHGQLRLNP